MSIEPLLIEKRELCELIPHTGAMCLLDGVRTWDATAILCLSTTHRDRYNPLRSHGRLNAVHGLEYGAQAAALHGSLLARAASASATFGYLAAFRDVRLEVSRLDTIEESLEVSAERIMGNGASQSYRSRVMVGRRVLVSGRLIVMLTNLASSQ